MSFFFCYLLWAGASSTQILYISLVSHDMRDLVPYDRVHLLKAVDVLMIDANNSTSLLPYPILPFLALVGVNLVKLNGYCNA